MGGGDEYATRLDPRTALTAAFLRQVVAGVLELYPELALVDMVGGSGGREGAQPEGEAKDVGETKVTAAEGQDARAFVRSVVESRYLAGSPSLAEREPVLGCGAEWSEARCVNVDVGQAVARMLPKVAQDAGEVVALFADLPLSARHNDGVAGLLLGDYLEQIASEVVGPTRVCPFLRCVSTSVAW